MKKQILFVDDERNFLDGLRRMLRDKRDEWDMYFASTVDEAMGHIESNSVDVIICDVSMPGQDGFCFLQNLRENSKTCDIPVIILTGNNDRVLKRQALDAGATDLLNKPVDSAYLLARLQSVLRLKFYQDELKDQNHILDQRVAERTAALEDSRLDLILRLGKASEYRDEATGCHIVRVGCYCRALAEELKMSREFIETIFLASPLHDIGKIGIPDTIMLKPGELTPEEWKIMQRHCEIGVNILLQEPSGMKPFLRWHRTRLNKKVQDNPLLIMAGVISNYHHERWDGNGYPEGLKGDEIPIEARIVALADVYDALRSHRPYKAPYSEARATQIIYEGSGSHFDPVIVEAFRNVREVFREIHDRFSEELAVSVEI
ncbi:MAG: response regulator [Sedimentisphaerales bacterium]|nr:response regulator [Sedimentisphaerales bacterium]